MLGSIALLLSLSACTHPDRLTTFSYTRRPVGYDWTAHRDLTTGAIGYYGIDPSNGWTVYVGPDGLYYTFRHRGAITPGDLQSLWDPRDARGTAAKPDAATNTAPGACATATPGDAGIPTP